MSTLKEWRARRLLTVRDLAAAANVAPTTVYLVETGRSTPTFRVIRALSAALDVQPEDVAEFAAAIAAVGHGKVIAEDPTGDDGCGRTTNRRARPLQQRTSPHAAAEPRHDDVEPTQSAELRRAPRMEPEDA